MNQDREGKMEVTYELPEEEKAQIRTEETFRLAVRRELEAKESISSRKSHVWRILNSSFVLWFLSSVVVASMAAVFAKLEARRAESNKRNETIQRLDTEIAERLFMVRTELCLYRGDVIAAKSIYNHAVDYLDNSQTNNGRPLDFSVYPEYKTRTFRSLLFELSPIVDSSQLSLLKELLIDYEKITDQTAVLKDRIDLEESSTAREVLLNKVNKYLAENRWRNRSMTTTGECGY
jgi:hypothetical protein